MNSKTVFALDIGSSSLKGLVAAIHPKQTSVDILAQARVKASGIRRGIIFDVEDAARSLSELLNELEGMYKHEISDVHVMIGGPCLETRFAKGNILVSRPDEQIGQEDINRMYDTIQTLPAPQNRTVLHVIPQSFIIDEVDRVKTPLGMQGNRLSLEATVIDVFNQAFISLQKVFNVVGLRPVSTVAHPLASAKALLPKRDREQGVCAIDFGAETTSLSVFEDDELRHLAVIPLGSQNITNDIANALRIHFDSAERIKIGFGSALASKVNKKDMVDLSQFIEGEEATVSRKYIADIVEARLSEILDFVNDELKKLGKAGKLPAGAVLYGGGSDLPFIKDMVKRDLKLSVRKADLSHYNRLFHEEMPTDMFGAYSMLVWLFDSVAGVEHQAYQKGISGLLRRVMDTFLP